MKRSTILLIALVAVVAVAAIGYRQLRNTTTAVDTAAVVDRFETTSTTDFGGFDSVPPTTSAPPAAVPLSAPGLPEPGVYRLDLRGEERIDLLTGAGHAYPGESFLTVTATDCGADLRWDFIVERWQSWSFCETDDGPTLVGERIYHSFFGQEDLVERSCADSLLSSGTTRWTCTGDTSIAVRNVSVEPSSETVDGLGVREVVVLRSELLEGDHPSNVETIELWWDVETGLPVFEERFYDFVLETPFGEAAYDETYRATVVALTPIS